MSMNVYVGIAVSGFAASHRERVVSAIERFLREERLEPDFARAQGVRTCCVLERVDGGDLIAAGSTSALVVAGDAERWRSELEARLAAAVARELDAQRALRGEVRLRYADDPYDGRGPYDVGLLETVLHFVETAQHDALEGYRGKALVPLLEHLACAYPELPAWEQREAVALVTLDHAASCLERVWVDLARAPDARESLTSRHHAKAIALARLEGDFELFVRYLDDVGLTNRVGRRVAAGERATDARRAELAARTAGKKSLLGALPELGPRPDPLKGDDRMGSHGLTLSSRTSRHVKQLEQIFASRGLPPGGFVWRELLEMLAPEREPELLTRVRLIADPESLWIESEVHASGRVVPLVRELLEDGELLESLLARAPERLAARRAAHAALDPRYAEDPLVLAERLYDDPPEDEDELLAIARHPEPFLHETLLQSDAELGPAVLEALQQSPWPAVRRSAAERGSG